MRRFFVLAIIGLTFLATAALSGPRNGLAADAYQGQQIFEQWCTSCHAKGGMRRARDAAPPLTAIVEKESLTPDALRRWLANPHPPMPNLSLGRLEIENLIAYFESLRKK